MRSLARRPDVTAAVSTLFLLAAAGCGASRAGNRGACPITRPSGPRPPRGALLNFGNPIASASAPGWYGNGALWTQLPAPSQFARDPRAHTIGLKIGWFRARPGGVTVEARPLGSRPAPFLAQVGTPAEYGPTGFVASGLHFGRPGCWRLRAHLAGTVLTVMLHVPPTAR